MGGGLANPHHQEPGIPPVIRSWRPSLPRGVAIGGIVGVNATGYSIGTTTSEGEMNVIASPESPWTW